MASTEIDTTFTAVLLVLKANYSKPAMLVKHVVQYHSLSRSVSESIRRHFKQHKLQ